jgi:hypothetical protein
VSDEYDRLYASLPRPPARLSPGQPGELLFEAVRASDAKRFRFELRPHGDDGVDVQILDEDGEIISTRFFHPRLDPATGPRELAVRWAMCERAKC